MLTLYVVTLFLAMVLLTLLSSPYAMLSLTKGSDLQGTTPYSTGGHYILRNQLKIVVSTDNFGRLVRFHSL
jgi:hypothetical protein